MERDAFLFYRSFADAIKDLDDETRLKFLDAIIKYGIYGIETKLDGIPAIIYTMAKPQIDANNRKYENGKKGGRPKKETNGFENENQRFLEKKPKEKEKDKEKEKEKDKEKVKDNINYQEIQNLYNGICKSLPEMTRLSEKRKQAIRSRLKTYSVDDLKKAFQMAEESDFISGRSGKWTGANFDWLMKEANLIKVLEGNYKNNKTSHIEINPEFRRFQEEHELVHFNVN